MSCEGMCYSKLVDFLLIYFNFVSQDLKNSYYTDYVKNILKKKKASQARLDGVGYAIFSVNQLVAKYHKEYVNKIKEPDLLRIVQMFSIK